MKAPWLSRVITFPGAGEYEVTAYLIPSHPILAQASLQFYVACDDAPPQLVVANVKDGSQAWAESVLNATVQAKGVVSVASAGLHELRIYGSDTGVAIDKVVVHRGPLPPSYFGPPVK